MSEHQFVAFRAIDIPVSEENLEFMRRQSSRAQINPWSFENEYHYGDFRGNALEMLRRGYDIHLHYANFGTRRLCIRLPEGLPNPKATQAYLGKDGVTFVKDRQRPAGTLMIDPAYEPGFLEELWHIDGLLEQLAPLRAEIMEGDLRPLYLMHLAAARDMNHDPEVTLEAPVPLGLDALTRAQQALAALYELDDAFIAAAAQASPPLASQSDARTPPDAWLAAQSEARKTSWLVRLLESAPSAVRAEILSEYRQSQGAAWPTTPGSRTITQLESASEAIAQESRRKADVQAAAERAAQLSRMAADPEPFLLETERLVAERGERAYSKIGKLLVDLREALAGSDRADLAEKQARKLHKEHPKRNTLISELRRLELIAKRGK
jgi:hypothetical protein